MALLNIKFSSLCKTRIIDISDLTYLTHKSRGPKINILNVSAFYTGCLMFYAIFVWNMEWGLSCIFSVTLLQQVIILADVSPHASLSFLDLIIKIKITGMESNESAGVTWSLIVLDTWHVTRVTRDTRHKQGVKWEHLMSMKLQPSVVLSLSNLDI